VKKYVWRSLKTSNEATAIALGRWHLEIEMRRHRGEVVDIVIHVVAVADLAGPAVSAAVMSDDAIAVVEEEQHLGVPIVADSGQPWLKTMGRPLPQSL
jgi:hypothetical protein